LNSSILYRRGRGGRNIYIYIVGYIRPWTGKSAEKNTHVFIPLTRYEMNNNNLNVTVTITIIDSHIESSTVNNIW
jgi:hypothetical protein